MRQPVKITILAALTVATIGLSFALFGLRQVAAQTEPADFWKADSAVDAVNALLYTGRFTYLDRIQIPGTYHSNGSKIGPLTKKAKGLSSGPPSVKIARRDGSFAYRAFRPDPAPYIGQNAYPLLRLEPKKTGTNVPGGVKPKIEITGQRGTRLKLGDNEARSKKTPEPVFTGRGKTEADKVAFSFKPEKKSKKKNSKFAITKVQARDLKNQVKKVLKQGGGKAKTHFAGSFNDHIVHFMPIVTVKEKAVEEFRVEVHHEEPRTAP